MSEDTVSGASEPAQAPPVAKNGAPKKETDAERSKRHAAELETHRQAHLANVQQAHKRFPTPQGVAFHDMSRAQKLNFREKQKIVISANRAYWRAVRQTCTRHRAETAIPIAVQQRAVRGARAAEQRRRENSR